MSSPDPTRDYSDNTCSECYRYTRVAYMEGREEPVCKDCFIFLQKGGEKNMPDVSELSEFISPGDDVKDGESIVILDEGSFVTFNAGKADEKKSLQLKVKCPSGKIKKWTVNKTSLNQLKEEWGKNSSAWVGKTVLVEVVKVNTPNGPKKTIIGYASAEKKTPGEINLDAE